MMYADESYYKEHDRGNLTGKELEQYLTRANWLHDNQTMLETYLKNYSINGVSMTMEGAWNVHIENGVAIRSDLYELLENTGLCCTNFNWGAWQYE